MVAARARREQPDDGDVVPGLGGEHAGAEAGDEHGGHRHGQETRQRPDGKNSVAVSGTSVVLRSSLCRCSRAAVPAGRAAPEAGRAACLMPPISSGAPAKHEGDMQQAGEEGEQEPRIQLPCPSPRASRNATSAAKTKARRSRMVARRTRSARRTERTMQPGQRDEQEPLRRVAPGPGRAALRPKRASPARQSRWRWAGWCGSPKGSQAGGAAKAAIPGRHFARAPHAPALLHKPGRQRREPGEHGKESGA